jgi:PhzF family phenazine biosynthesis protein
LNGDFGRYLGLFASQSKGSHAICPHALDLDEAGMIPKIYLTRIFAAGPDGGNPAPIVMDAAGLSDAQMQEIARGYGHESGFVLPAPVASDCDFALRFWVPNHEMEMCGHATVGAVWLLDHLGRLPRDHVSIWTRSGRVEARVAERNAFGNRVEITQPQGRVDPLADAESAKTEILSVLGIASNALAPSPIRNACTSRIKTLVPLNSVATLDGLRPNFQRVEQVCDRIGSTGLYPYAVADLAGQVFDARQFPKSSGYPEDAATGIAAAALVFGLLESGLVERTDRPIRVRQGRAMGCPSEIVLRLCMNGDDVQCCWLGGSVQLMETLVMR